VTLAEEMPVAETLETCAQLREPLQMPIGWVVVNRLHRRRFPPATIAALESAAATRPDERALLTCIAERAAEESGWASINEANLERLRGGVGDAPLVQLPFLFVEEFGMDELAQLSAMLESAVEARPAAAVRRRS
jgi:hypothetical protein